MHCKMPFKYLSMQDMLLGPAKGLFYFPAWKCISMNFSHQNHYKLYVKVKISSQTCSTNSTNSVQSCIEVCKLKMMWVMLDMDNSAPLAPCLAGPCVQSWWEQLGKGVLVIWHGCKNSTPYKGFVPALILFCDKQRASTSYLYDGIMDYCFL